MCRIAYTFIFFVAVCSGRRKKLALQQFDEDRPISRSLACGQREQTHACRFAQRGLRAGVVDQSDGLGALLLALAPGLGVRPRIRNLGMVQNHLRHPIAEMRFASMRANDEKSQRSPHPRMQALLDSLTRRGEDLGLVVDNQYFSSRENKQLLEKYNERVGRINALEDEIEQLEDDELAAKTEEFRKRLLQGETEDDIMEEAFAVVREAAWRTLDLRHYDVQLIGAMGLHDGMVTQMGTGEGKTLVSTCAVYLNALRQGGNFLVTVNDYLARRDSEQMGQVYRFLGLSVGLIQQGLNVEQRKQAYSCDITYVTNSELGFDYLRDHCQTMQPEQVVLPPELNFCVVDEGDAVLIDDARTPLIISGESQNTGAADRYVQASKLAAALVKELSYTVADKEESVVLTEKGMEFIEGALQVENIADPSDPWLGYIINCIKAKEFKIRDKDYLVKDGKVEIVDVFTGRVLEGRRFGGGLHQAIEAKEGVEIRPETEQVAQITYPALFGMFKKLSAMSGTVITEAEEFATFYGLKVLDVPPALPKQRVDVPNSVYKTRQAKTKAVFDELQAMHESGRPILLGTTTVEISELCSKRLDDLGIKHEVLNAKPESIEREAEIVAQAGRKGAVTIATNMAGRGTDILLGGSPAFMASLRVRDSFAAAAGISVPVVSDDFYPCTLSAESLKMLEDAAAQFVTEEERKETNDLRKLDLDELMAVASSSAPVYEGSAEDLAREAYDAIKEQYDAALASEKEEVTRIGGLHVIGTNLHDSRRIDDQLRGRAGRQGDPGSSHFFLSLEDRIFQTFNADKIKDVLDFLRVPDDTPLESDAVTKAVKNTQEKVEQYFYGIRKTTSEVEVVLNSQRRKWYSIRDQALRRDEPQTLQWLKDKAQDIMEHVIQITYEKSEEDLPKRIAINAQSFFPGIDLSEAVLAGKSREELTSVAKEAALAAIERKTESLNSFKGELAFVSARYVALINADSLWQKHMKELNHIKEFAGFQVYRGETPTAYYMKQGEELFEKLETSWLSSTILSLLKYDPGAKPE